MRTLAESALGRYGVRMSETSIHCPACGHHLFDADISALLTSSETVDAHALTPGAADAAGVLTRFFSEQTRVLRTERGRMLKGDVIREVNGWLEANGEEPLSNHAFGRGMAAIGIESAKSNGQRFYRGVAFTHSR
ncbi:hypothetical protein [Microbacterium imperiale]|uniref:Uncharacterized protein n=1 Tax=Microbacterium imperiale TaxID=33884 RepID=A0A9W6HEN1_9MICO|nr:hypothetical protein [Microbacterium imperiale]MBP2420013.1 hypothetical protein [Microbacterium imperiale]MDS0198123.1 hypothetical protein [Microbacterium imperiale]BFE40355.1 hypothetical protein GCM10017544_13110 [Microbacterium imperiale]GLJ78669.1 hypothetical protein GCM10017586_03510 [Microbacterium imperiale]